MHRWYQAETGKYSRVDPLGLRAGIHSLIYANGRVATMTDPLGLEPKPSSAGWCDERPVLFQLCECSREEASASLGETLALRAQFCNGTGVSHRSRISNPVASGAFGVAGSVDGGRAWYDPSVIGDDPCLAACTCVHEENHASALHDPRLVQLRMVGVPTADILDWLECMAYSDEAVCLSGFLGNL